MFLYFTILYDIPLSLLQNSVVQYDSRAISCCSLIPSKIARIAKRYVISGIKFIYLSNHLNLQIMLGKIVDVRKVAGNWSFYWI